MSGGTKTTTNNVEKVTLPAWMSQGGQDNFQQAQAWSAANPVKSYTGPLTAGMNGNQTQAGQLAGAGSGAAADFAAARGYTDAAAGAPAPTVQAGNVSTSMFDQAAAEKYMNPYLAKVQDSTLGSMRRQAAMDQAGLADQIQASNAFGGARGALAQTELNRNQSGERVDYLNSSNADAFNQARGQFNTDRGIQLGVDTGNRDAQFAASQFNANAQESLLDRLMAASSQRSAIGTASQATNSDDINNLLRTGATAQNTEQAGYDANLNNFLRDQNAGMDRFTQLASLLGMTPSDKTATSKGTTQQSGSLLNTLLSVGQIAASAGAFSDRRLKRDITPIGKDIGGVPAFAYRYLWSDEPYIGVMADDVARLRPDAIGPTVGGYATVNYERLAA